MIFFGLVSNQKNTPMAFEPEIYFFNTSNKETNKISYAI